MTDPIDCAVVGARPAGLVAALYLLRFRRSVLITDRGGDLAPSIPHSHDFPGLPEGLSEKQLLSLLREKVERYGRPVWGGEVAAVEKSGDAWRVVMHDRIAVARRVLFAEGLVDRWPRMLGAREAVDRGVLRFCPIRDGSEARNARVAVIGENDHAAREAIILRTHSPSVSLLSDGRALSAGIPGQLTREGVALTPFRADSLRFVGGAIWAADPDGKDLEPFDIAYSALGVEPQTQLLAALGVNLDPSGYVSVDLLQQTSVPGIYAAGDAVRGLDQMSVAVGEAVIGATAIHNSLCEQDG